MQSVKDKQRYAINQSPLYKIQSKKKLAELLRLSISEIKSIKNNIKNNYYIKTIQDKNSEKKRKCECPTGQLKYIHKRLFTLLIRIEPPAYLQSGIKGRSYITNAEKHLNATRLITMDIEKFFPSTKFWHVYGFFNDILKCSPDVAHALTVLTTYDNHIPTGSPISQILAFYSHYGMFNAIDDFATSENLTFTCYVDDITLSGNKATKKAQYHVRGLLKSRSLSSPRRKEHFYELGKPKHVTGSVINKDRLFLPNKKHKKIFDILHDIKNANDIAYRLELLNSNIGRANAALQSDRGNPKISSMLNIMYQERAVLEKL